MKNIDNYITLASQSDFTFFNNNKLVFLDNAATTLKPKVVIEAINDYYQNYSINTHSIDYQLAVKGKEIYESCRDTVANFINANKNEVIFCSSATFALNQIFYSLSNYLNAGDEIITTYSEHNSLLLPLYRLKKEKAINIKFVALNKNSTINLQDLENNISHKTKVVAFANMNNSFGAINDCKAIAKIVKNSANELKYNKLWPFNEILLLIDGAQAALHIPTDVKEWNIDFFVMAGHKLLGPTGIGVWWTKNKWLKLMSPLILGGGNVSEINNADIIIYNNSPEAFEAGSPNVAGVFGLQAAIKYLKTFSFADIKNHELHLKKYLITKLKSNFNNKIKIYNSELNNSFSTVIFNVVGVFAEEVATFLGIKNICVRSGNYCAQFLNSVIDTPASIRVSFCIYNSKADVDKLIAALKTGFTNQGDFLNAFFD